MNGWRAISWTAARRCLPWLLAGAAGACAGNVMAQPSQFNFAVIAHAANGADDTALRAAIAETDADNLAFVVANGIKSNSEPCSDSLYTSRKELLNEAKNGLIVSLTASDWSECRNLKNRSAAVERLNRLRELFFTDEFSFGASKIPVIRQSGTSKFRNYAENTRWEIGTVMFATINLPANNNHYRTEAGRNSEFEDRLIANRDWLQRIFAFAARKKMAGIVLFCDGDPLAKPGLLQLFDLNRKRDGFAEVRGQINALAAKFSIKVLVIHGQEETKPATPSSIIWRDNVGDLALGGGWSKISVNSSAPALFAISAPLTELKTSRNEPR